MHIALLIIVSLFSTNYGVKLSDNCRNFSLEIVYFTAFSNEPSNIFLSPYSLWTLMFDVTLAASGTSEKELRRALILPKKERQVLIDDYINLMDYAISPYLTDGLINTNNTVFADEDFKIEDDFSSIAIHTIKTVNVNNGSLESFTDGMISDKDIPDSGIRVTNTVILKDVHNTSRIIFKNWIRFNSLWGLPFDESATTVQPFYDENGAMVGEVNMMYGRDRFPFSNLREVSAFVLELPFESEGRYCMLILLPWTGKNVRDVYENLSEYPVKNIFYKIYNDTRNYGLQYVDVQIPRFRIGTHVELTKPFNDMNVNSIFIRGESNFGRITNESIYVSSVTQIADIEVTESGVVSSDTVNVNSTRKITTPGYTANKPFVYLIVEKSSVSVIFAGIYSKPTVY